MAKTIWSDPADGDPVRPIRIEEDMAIDFILQIISYLPKLFNWWLYSPRRTEANIEVSISASESSIEIWCSQNQFRVRVGFRNSNPFPIEIDRLVVRASYHSATLVAKERFGARIAPKKQIILSAEGEFDTTTEARIKEARDDTTIGLEIRALIINRRHRMRDFRSSFPNQLCRVTNKHV